MAKKLTIRGLEKMIREEVAKYEADLEKKASETQEYEPGEEADTLEKHVDHTPDEPKVESVRRKNAKLVAEERKLRKALVRVRKQRQALQEKARRRRRRK